MDKNEDYYGVLGVTPSAEDIVIRAAYKALSQRYHPDKAREDPSIASTKMAVINEAYAILSDADKRKKYDELRGVGAQSGDTIFEEDTERANGGSPLDADWKTASQFYPEILDLESRLSKISWRVALAFKASLLECKLFENANSIARHLESEFLKVYFGSNQYILDYANHLIHIGNKKAARDLNKAVKVLGDQIDPGRVIATIKNKYGLDKKNTDKEGSRGNPKDKNESGSSKTNNRVQSVYNFAEKRRYKPEDVIDSIRFGNIEGFEKNGMWYVKVNEWGEYVQKENKQESSGGCLGAAVFLATSVAIVLVVLANVGD